MKNMPIKEILTFTLGSLAVLLATHGRTDFLTTIHKAQFQMLKQVAPTAGWENPSIFSGSARSKRVPRRLDRARKVGVLSEHG